ncbi:probable LRR receptor-like serine/threonine-protein kinase At4g36180 [Cryptomeria japonica]|uniref:probable LRR receptor-like serine/threonine-protein kinase At4g36180 n=1 Tax=Cryptomeria japonica TaxID=3369 RepID=UPI0027D9DEEF|nr:probable LRR receptor-like serine/threonine-protein kinase At4g36180 [Cryptomeria japonica]
MESGALLSLNFTFKLMDSSTPWTNETDCCEWHGIKCDENNSHVLGISVGIMEGLLIDDGIRGGVIADSLCKLPFLTRLDIWDTAATGHLPKSIGNISALQVLVMNDNQFSGEILSEIGDLKQLQILDLSSNNLSGSIPHNIVFLEAMAVAREDAYATYSELNYGGYVIRKFFSLGGLDVTSKGNIPSELQSLSYLGYLNLSNNNLSGNIPQGGQMITFENTSYSGNQYLQGCPLPRNCSWPKFAPPPPVSAAENKDEKETEQIPWYQIGVGWSYGAGFLIVVVLLLSVRQGLDGKFRKLNRLNSTLINFDGTVKGNPGKVGSAGVLRNGSAQPVSFLLLIAVILPITWMKHRGIPLAICKGWKRLWVEGDSMLLIDAIHDGRTGMPDKIRWENIFYEAINLSREDNKEHPLDARRDCDCSG